MVIRLIFNKVDSIVLLFAQRYQKLRLWRWFYTSGGPSGY
jgi:hypothetical protein